ncbi:hypothetical protein [Elioraea sp.]|uniref:hypothetical protein n=1 Tax=Elioraea sp. TaxID=2185103 RepID=UPI0025BB6BEE|nr:hypothetical protein [Elioraea sp.]
MIRALGPAWVIAGVLGLVSLGAAAAAVVLGEGASIDRLVALGAVALALLATVMALAAGPLALAPGEALKASLAGSARQPWGAEREDLWGELSRAVAAAIAPAPPPPDTGLEARRLAANLELTLRETGAELAATRAAMADAAGTLSDAAASGGRLSAVAAEATRQLTEAVRRTDDATGALSVLPALAAEQARVLEAAASRSTEAASALAAAAEEARAAREPEGPSPAMLAFEEVLARGADQARRLDQTMPLLLEAIGRLPVAATSQARLDAAASEFSRLVGSFELGLDRLCATTRDIAAAGEGMAPPDFAAILSPSIARLEGLAGQVEGTAREAADAAVTRVCDIAEVMAIEASWRAGEAAAEAARRIDAAATALKDDAGAVAGRIGAELDPLIAALGMAQEEGERAAAAALARIEAPLAGHLAAVMPVAERLDAATERLSQGLAASAEAAEAGRAAADAMSERTEATIAALSAVTATLENTVAALTAPPPELPVSGDEPLDSVAERLLAELGGDDDAPAPVFRESLDETIRRLQAAVGAMAPQIASRR